MTRFFRPETAFVLLVWLALLGLFRERGFYDPGSLWHIKVGELILDRGFMHTDPFTYTHEGKTWIPQQWGAEVLMALAHRIGGLDLLLLGFATGVAGLFTWVFARMRQAGMHWVLAGMLTGACLFGGSFHYFVRPHMFTIAFLAWTMGCLVDFDRGRVSFWRLAGLIPLYVVWTNLHGGVLGGVMTLGLAVAGWGLRFLFGADSPVKSWRTGWLLIAVVAACGLTPFVNPFGMEMIHTWQRIVASPVLKEAVTEHKPLDVTQAADQVIVGFGVLYAFLLAGVWSGPYRITWAIPLVWLVLTVTQGIRQGPLFVITAALTIPDIWPHTAWCRLLKRYGDSLVVDPASVKRPGWPAFVLPAAAVLLALGLQLGGVSAPLVGRGWARLDPNFVPDELTPVLKEYARTHGPGARVFNDANLGGYLIYHIPELKIFMDDRFELYGEAWTREYVEAYRGHPERIEDWADRYHLDLAVVVTGPERSKLDEYLGHSGRWAEVARARCAVVYRRTK